MLRLGLPEHAGNGTVTPLGLELVAEDKHTEFSWYVDVGYHMRDTIDLIHCCALT